MLVQDRMYTINFRARRMSKSIAEYQDSMYTNEFRISRAQTTVTQCIHRLGAHWMRRGGLSGYK